MSRAIAVALGVALCVAGCGTSRKNQLERVAKDWCQTIRASQVIPVYPLTEDIQPGDVFLVDLDVSKQHEQYEEKGFLPLDNHLVRLAKVDYAAFYADSFEPGDPLPKIWLGQSPPFKDKAPKAAFPSYTFTATRSGGLNLAVPVSGVPVGLSLLGANEATGSVTISDAVTYGISIVDLAERVRLWADVHRGFLESYVSKEGARRYLRVVSRVYLTGGVDITLQDARSVGGSGTVGAVRPVELVTAGTDADTEAATAENYANNVSQLGTMAEEAMKAAGAGGSIKVAAASARSITLKERFARPLVIGYLGFDMEIRENGDLGPPAPSLAAVAQGRVPESRSFFSDVDQDYMRAVDRAARDAALRARVRERLELAESADDDEPAFRAAMTGWLIGQSDRDAAKRRVIEIVGGTR